MSDDTQDNQTDSDANESEGERCDVDDSFHEMRVQRPNVQN